MFGTALFIAALSAAPAEKLSNRALFEQTARATAHVAVVRDGKARSAGTGFVIDAKRRWLVTNYHVVSEGTCLATFPQFKDGRVVSDRKAYDLGKGVKGTVLDSDPSRDLALVELDSLPDGVKELKLAAEKPQPGDMLHLVGNPSASSGYFIYTIGRARGAVKKSSFYGPKQTLDCSVIEAQMDCNNGDSGAPCVNDDGELIGVHSGSEKSAHIRGFAWHVDADELRTFYADVAALSDKTKAAPADAYERRGHRQRLKGNNDLAIADYGRAVDLDPKLAQAYRWRSRLYFLKGHKDAALADGYRAVEAAPRDGHAYNERGNAFYSRGGHRRAVQDYTEATRLLPDDAVLRVNRARAYIGRKQYEQALDDLAQAMKLSPRFLDSYQERGDLYYARKDYKQAITDYRAGLGVAGNNAVLLARLGHALYHDGQAAQAAESYLLALKSGTKELGAVNRSLGFARYNLKQYEQAAEAFTQALKYEPNNAALWMYRGASLEERGELEQAQADYRKAIEMGHPEAKGLRTFNTRTVRVHNATTETLKVFMSYETPGKDGRWAKMPSIEWTLQPGQPLFLLYNNVTVQARSCRIWAVGARSGKTWDTLKNRTVLLVESPYLAKKQDSHLHKFE